MGGGGFVESGRGVVRAHSRPAVSSAGYGKTPFKIVALYKIMHPEHAMYAAEKPRLITTADMAG
jgi:hypothetical protein